jgi:hypothetical protein
MEYAYGFASGIIFVLMIGIPLGLPRKRKVLAGSVWSVAWRWADSETDKVELFRTHNEALQMVGRLAVDGYSLSANKTPAQLRVFAYITIKELKL